MIESEDTQVRTYSLELILCAALLSLILAGSEGPADMLAREVYLENTQPAVIHPPDKPPNQPAQNTTPVAGVNKHNGILPVRIQIPSVKIDAIVQPVGVLKNGAMGVPNDDTKVGWLRVGYKPGENGNSVMAGHVDNLQGVAVFHPLHRIKKGADVIVSDKVGSKLTFAVTDIKTYRAEQAPIDFIFGQADVPKLNLITCTGYFDPKLRTHIDRLVIFTELKQ
jgi:sortase A